MTGFSEIGLTPQDGLASGEVGFGELSVDGARIRGSVTLSPEASGACHVLVVATDEVVTRLPLTPDARNAPVSFEADIPVSFFRPPLLLELRVYVQDEAGKVSQLPLSGSAAELNLVRVGTKADLIRLVQSPTERLKNANLLFYIAYHALDRFAGDFPCNSACICVMGYRLIEGLVVPDSARAVFWRVVEGLLQATPNVTRGLWMRWHTSLRLVAGYLAFNNGDTEKSASFFDGIADFAFELSHWPAALTNVLIGIFLAGWTHYQRGEFAAAAKSWRRAEGVLRYGGGIAQFTNFYAYGEMANAIKVAQECYIGCVQAENGGKPCTDVRIVPAGYELDIRHLPGLRHNLGLSNQK